MTDATIDRKSAMLARANEALHEMRQAKDLAEQKAKEVERELELMQEKLAAMNPDYPRLIDHTDSVGYIAQYKVQLMAGPSLRYAGLNDDDAPWICSDDEGGALVCASVRGTDVTDEREHVYVIGVKLDDLLSKFIEVYTDQDEEDDPAQIAMVRDAFASAVQKLTDALNENAT